MMVIAIIYTHTLGIALYSMVIHMRCGSIKRITFALYLYVDLVLDSAYLPYYFLTSISFVYLTHWNHYWTHLNHSHHSYLQQ